jgi:hypothetical protein
MDRAAMIARGNGAVDVHAMAGREVGSMGAGAHVVDLAGNEELSAGIYVVRLSSGSSALAIKAAVIP